MYHYRFYNDAIIKKNPIFFYIHIYYTTIGVISLVKMLLFKTNINHLCVGKSVPTISMCIRYVLIEEKTSSVL